MRGEGLGVHLESWVTNSLANLGILVSSCLPDPANCKHLHVCRGGERVVYMGVETRSQPQMSLLRRHPPCFMRQGDFIDLELAGLTSPAGWQTEGSTNICLPRAGMASMH